jgi:hypothetical protein
VVARFESEDAARRNSERPEQGTWWADTSKCFAGDVSFRDFTDVSTWLAGGSDDAGFVQIIEGHFKDLARMRTMMDQHGDEVQRARPEIIGATVAMDQDGAYAQAVYFTSEAEARAHEAMPPPADVAEMMSEEMQDATFLDLHQPLLTSPADAAGPGIR